MGKHFPLNFFNVVRACIPNLKVQVVFVAMCGLNIDANACERLFRGVLSDMRAFFLQVWRERGEGSCPPHLPHVQQDPGLHPREPQQTRPPPRSQGRYIVKLEVPTDHKELLK